jgi:DNA polymerase III epsilon subunit-like protein
MTTNAGTAGTAGTARTPNYVIYDVETGGLDIIQTPLLQFTMRDGASGTVMLNQYIFPHEGGVITPGAAALHKIDDDMLNKAGAVSLQSACATISAIIRKKFGRQAVIWVAYNNFGFDQLVMECAFKRANIRMPDQWAFMDLLPLVRSKLNIQPNYKLESVYFKLCRPAQTADPISFHDALDDTKCLYDVFEVCHDLFKDDLANYTRPKIDSHAMMCHMPLNIFISGYHPNFNLSQYNCSTVGNMYNKFCESDANMSEFKVALHRDFNITSAYRTERMSQYMNIMHHIFSSSVD